ncbi:MAG: hypothetical protein SFV54_06035 [Bryobacteraceae bacterium]|nr:hypothetical protein [Bryobacteraceae bacterium]
MKTIALVLTVTLAAVVTAPAAQIATYAKADIPFAFEVDGKQMPAGLYWVKSSYEAGRRLVVQREDGAAATIVIGLTQTKAESCACLSFYVLGEKKVLAEVGVYGHGTAQLYSAVKAKKRHSEAPPQVVSVRLVTAD